jgi:hypothetical protein
VIYLKNKELKHWRKSQQNQGLQDAGIKPVTFRT